MPTINRIKRKVTVIDSCEFKDKISILRRTINDAAGADRRFGVTLTKLCDCYAVYDNSGAGVSYFDRVANQQAGITDYFYVKKSVHGLDKRCIVDYNGMRYNVSTMTDLGNYWRLNCTLNGSKDKVGSTI